MICLISRGTWLLAVVMVCLFCSPAPADEFVHVDRAEAVDIEPYVTALKESGLPAVDYVASKLKAHDIVMLGEKHGVRENCEFVAELIGPVYEKAGVRHFVTEFVPTRETQRANQLVNAPTFDRDLAIDIMRNHAWPTWGYEEYLLILKGVWELNASLPDAAEPMHIIGMDSDWSQHDLFFRYTDKATSMKLMMDREAHMVDVIRKQVLEPGHKALAHMGYAHSITSQGVRLGTVLHESYGDRIFQVCLHHAFFSQGGPASVTQLIERVVAESGRAPVGFDVLDTIFAPLRDPRNMAYSFGGERGLDELAQGYVLIRPIKDLQPVHWIDGFIYEGNYQQAIDVAGKMGLADPEQHDTPAKLDARLKQMTESP